MAGCPDEYEVTWYATNIDPLDPAMLHPNSPVQLTHPPDYRGNSGSGDVVRRIHAAIEGGFTVVLDQVPRMNVAYKFLDLIARSLGRAQQRGPNIVIDPD